MDRKVKKLNFQENKKIFEKIISHPIKLDGYKIVKVGMVLFFNF